MYVRCAIGGLGGFVIELALIEEAMLSVGGSHKIYITQTNVPELNYD